MEQLFYENQGTNTFLVYDISNAEVDTMTLGMLTNNKITGFVPVQFTQINNQRLVKYNVTSKVSMTQFMSGTVNRKRIMGVFEGISAALLAAEDYMLEVGSILLNTDYIFVDVTSCRAETVCLPVLNEAAEVNAVRDFFKQVIFSSQFEQTENCDYVARLLNYLNSTPVFSAKDFNRLILDIKKTERQEGVYSQGTPVNMPLSKPSPQKKAPQPEGMPPQAPQPRPAAAPVQSAGQPRPAQQKEAPPRPPQSAVHAAPPKVPAAPGNQGQRPPVPPQQLQAPQTAGAAARGRQAAGMPVPQAETETQMSWLYLMQHYNKDNAAAYKAQKEARKGAKKVPPQTQGQAVRTPPVQPSAPRSSGQGGQPPQPRPSQPPVQQPAAPPPQSGYQQMPRQQMAVPANPSPAQQYEPPKAIPYQQPAGSFGDTTVLRAEISRDTTVLSGGAAAVTPQRPYLLRVKNQEKIFINQPAFKIGKERSYVDYFIADNSAVSRSHATIIERNGEFFVMDTNSTNHTYVDGKMIQSNVEVPLMNGSMLRLANEEFEFKTVE